MSGDGDGAADSDARVAELERRRRGIDGLTRFRIEVYKARIAELRRAEALHLAERQSMRRELEALRRRNATLARELRRLGGTPEGDGE